MWPFAKAPEIAGGTLADAPGPSPWYLRRPGLTLPSARGPLRWRDLGAGGAGAGKSVLTDAGGAALLVVDFHCYVRPLTAPRFLIWHPEGGGGGAENTASTSVRFRVFDADELTPITDIDAAVAAMRPTGQIVAHRGREIASAVVPTSIPDGRNHVAFPDALHELNELLVLAHSTSGAVQSNYHDQMHLRLWVIRPREGIVDVIPQDWFNNGNFDFGYQWVTRVARDPKTGRIVGEGVRLPAAFILSRNCRRVSRWLRANPFESPAPPPRPP